MACKICGGMCRPEYDTCYNCKLKSGEVKSELPQKKNNDEFRDGQKRGLTHNLTLQYLLFMMKEMDKDNLETKQDYFWTTYNSVFDAFKKKIDENEK